MPRRGPAVVPGLLIAVVAGMWGSQYTFTAIGVEHTTPIVFAAIRSVLSLIVFIAATVLTWTHLPNGRLARWAALIGIMAVPYLWALTEATQRAGAADTAVIASMTPLAVLIGSRVLGAERITPLRLLGIFLGVVGVAGMVASELGRGGSDIGIGLALAGFAMLITAATAIIGRHVATADDYSPVSFLTVQYLVSTPITWLAVLPAAHDTEWSSPTLWWTAAAAGVGGGAIGVLAWMTLLRLIPATPSSSVTFLVPAVAILIEAARGTLPSGLTVAGMVGAVAGVALVNVKGLRAAAATPSIPAPAGRDPA